MKLDTEFLKLPLRFDAGQLATKVGRFNSVDWRACPQGHAGNTAGLPPTQCMAVWGPGFPVWGTPSTYRHRCDGEWTVDSNECEWAVGSVSFLIGVWVTL